MEMLEKSIIEIADVIAGQSPPSDSYNTKGDGLPFFQGKTDFGEKFPVEKKWCTNPKKTAEKGDILISVRAPVGPVNISIKKSCIGRGLSALRVKKENDYLYLYYFLKNNQHLISRYSSGSTFKAITQDSLKKIVVPIPKSLSNQKRIAHILSHCEDLITKRKESIVLLDAYVKSTFLEMFGDPVQNNKGWKTKTIEGLVKKERYSIKRGPFGGALKKEIFVPKGYLVYEQYHALNDDFSFERYYITEEKFQELNAFKIKEDDIIISCSGVNLGRLAIIPKEAKQGIINQALLKISLDQQIMNNILFVEIFTNKHFKQKFFGNVRGSGVPNFPPMSAFKKFKFICPPIKLQNQFATIVEKVEAIKANYEQSLTELENLYQSLSQKAFKGELELGGVEFDNFIDKGSSRIQVSDIESSNYYVKRRNIGDRLKQALISNDDNLVEKLLKELDNENDKGIDEIHSETSLDNILITNSFKKSKEDLRPWKTKPAKGKVKPFEVEKLDVEEKGLGEDVSDSSSSQEVKEDASNKKNIDYVHPSKDIEKNPKKRDITNLSLADFYGIPLDIQAEREKIEFDFIGDDLFYQFLLKDTFSKSSFTMEDIFEKLHNYFYHIGDMDFDYEEWKRIIYTFIDAKPPLLDQFFDETNATIKLKLTDEAFKA